MLGTRIGSWIRRSEIRFLQGGLFVLALTGCAPFLEGRPRPIVKECVVEADQTKTFSGKWKKQPIPIAFEAGAVAFGFDDNELSELMTSADAWNSFYSESLGIAPLDYGSSSSPNTNTSARPGSICTQGILVGSQYTGAVVIRAAETWPSNFPADAMAVTTTCTLGSSSGLPNFFMAVIDVNYRDFFVDGRRVPDMVSIMTHEMGHLLGLDHSCTDRSGISGNPQCSSDLPQSYLEAVMFPTFGFDESTGLGIPRRDLTENDMGRANCLYEDQRTN
jgi:hypothetical protein